MNLIKILLTGVFVAEAKATLRRHKPKIIGITGSAGKSSTKEAVFSVLASKYPARKSEKSYNSELGLALAVLGLKTAWRNPFGWIQNFVLGLKTVFGKNFARLLILEMGVDRPKDLERLLKIIRPEIGIVTAIGEIPVHVEFFSGSDEVAREKSKLIKNLPAGGFAILNYDDAAVLDMKQDARARVFSFGFGDGADVRATHEKISLDGTTFKMQYQGSTVPIKLEYVFGKQHIYAALAAAAAGIIHGMNLIEISQSLSDYKPPPGRMRLIKGIKNSFILDDSYNASPLATHAALDSLKELNGRRKIVVFGDMLELGKFTIVAHKAVGEQAAKFADYFLSVGPRSRFAAEEAVAQGMDRDKVVSFSTSQEAAIHLKSIIQEGDLILVKGSQAVRMERVVEENMANPEEAENLLARQDKFWRRLP